MKILFLIRYAPDEGSSRYRFTQFFDYYKEQKIEVSCQSFFSKEYLVNKYSGKRISRRYLLGRYLKRFLMVFKVGEFDLVVIEKEIFPSLPIFFEKIFYLFNKNWVVDYDDAVYVLYHGKIFLENKIAGVIKLSRAVVVANENLYNYAKKFSRNVYLIPDAVNSEKYLPKKEYVENEKIVIGWTGSPSTVGFLKVVSACLQEVAKEMPIVLRCVGVSNFSIDGVEVENIKWEEETEPEIVRTFDIGIMPLTDDAFSRGKSGLKIILYFASGVPTIASPVGWNKNIIINGENGFLADSESKWAECLRLLIKDRELRNKIGQAGRESFEKNFSLTEISPKYLNLYSTIVKKYKS